MRPRRLDYPRPVDAPRPETEFALCQGRDCHQEVWKLKGTRALCPACEAKRAR